MTKQHDFKGALEDYVEARMDDGSVLISGWIETEDAQALQKALRIADIRWKNCAATPHQFN